MSTTDLERRLADALREQAEEVVATAHTEARHQDLMRELRRVSRPDDVPRVEPARQARRGWAAGLAAAAAVALVVSLPALLPRQTEDWENPAMVPEPSAVRLARDFVEAFAAFDRDRAASYLAEDAEVRIWSTPSGGDRWRRGDRWRQSNRWLEAIGRKTILQSCRGTGTSELGTYVDCWFAFHALHSEQLGRGPYDAGLITFAVDDGEVVLVRQSSASEQFGVEMWDPFAEWVTENHPEAARLMYTDWPENTWESLTPRSIELWRELSREWVQQQRH